MDYTPHQVAAALSDLDNADADTKLDIETAMLRLSRAHRLLLEGVTQGKTVTSIIRAQGIAGNSTRLYHGALLSLTSIMNGGAA
ncbi:hypothetical protein KSX_27140 [Ktedonospora formicarum]|uniref:Uncharacterized protein n=1 Tax=Ktedonospora formicarum TaxID=2778364 RepID=A0A8J3HYY4_9CHLR|nr:hypothetical protein KSX_27140 [Ktedonospora formicarum]